MQRIDVGEYLVVDAEIMHGQITFRGTRIPVDAVLAMLAKGYLIEQLLKSWPELSRPAIEEAIVLASRALQERYAQPAEAAAGAVH